MADSDDLYDSMKVDDGLSTALSTETLTNKDILPSSFDNTPGSSADNLSIEIFKYQRFLRVKHNVALRSEQKIFKI